MRRPGIWVANGQPLDVNQMYGWQPGAVASFYEHLAANRVFDYQSANPDVPLIVRFQHPHNWRQDPLQSAKTLGQFVASKWAELKPLNPYVYFASHLNMHYENGDPRPANQVNYTTPEFYQQYANWVRTTADVIRSAAPDMRLVTPPFAFGFNEDGSPDSDGNPLKSWAGYDYLWETIRDYFDNILTFHAYWGYPAGGSVPDWLYEPELSSWYAFRWQRLLKLFETRYSQQARLIIDEVGSYGPADPDFTEQLLYFARQCLSDSRVIALTYFLWSDPANTPRYRLNAWSRIPDLTRHLGQLAGFTLTGPAAIDLADYAPDAADLSGILETAEPDLQPWPAPQKEEHTIRVLFEDGNVKVMALDEYLRSVVAGEVPSNWPAEALKAQAVASRSYAQYAVEHPRHRPIADICTTTHCQHYAPDKINNNTDAAVAQTSGLIASYQGQTVNAVFSARCGGHTRNNEDVWTGGSPRAYLRGVPCPDTGEKQGHGVGLCQQGARVLAEQGKTFAEIINHYYQGAEVESISSQKD